MTHETCRKCLLTKEISEFTKNKNCKNGIAKICLSCKREYRKKYRDKKSIKMIPKQYIISDEILAISGASRAKLQIVSKCNKWGFPASCGKIGKHVIYPRKEVYEWLENNPLKNMVLSRAEKRKLGDTIWPPNQKFDHKNAMLFCAGHFDNAEKKSQYQQLLANAKNYARKTITVQLHEALNKLEQPRSEFDNFS